MEDIRLDAQWIDYLLIAIYFIFVLGIGWFAKRRVSSSIEFLLSGRSLPAWVTALAFVSANLGATELLGQAANGAQFGEQAFHYYWIGAIPAMVFLALVMMPFYYGSRARSAPEYLKLRFDEKTRTLNAGSFALMTIFSSGASMYAMGKLFNLLLGWSFTTSVWASAAAKAVSTRSISGIGSMSGRYMTTGVNPPTAVRRWSASTVAICCGSAGRKPSGPSSVAARPTSRISASTRAGASW